MGGMLDPHCVKTRFTFIAEQGHERAGKHHEIYLGNPTRSSPEKLKTIIRQPMRR